MGGFPAGQHPFDAIVANAFGSADHATGLSTGAEQPGSVFFHDKRSAYCLSAERHGRFLKGAADVDDFFGRRGAPVDAVCRPATAIACKLSGDDARIITDDLGRLVADPVHPCKPALVAGQCINDDQADQFEAAGPFVGIVAQ